MTKIIVDANWLVCRTWWSAKDSVPRRFTLVLEKATPKNAEVILAWDDPSGQSWRRDIYPKYKASRASKPKALVDALRTCQQSHGGVVAEGMEADDLAATYVRRALNGDACVLYSPDKDWSQLVGPRVLQFDGSNVLDEAAVRAKFGVPPDRIRHLLSWMGDKVDGLPGMRGYGRKRAIEAALAGRIGNPLTYELSALADVPDALMRRTT